MKKRLVTINERTTFVRRRNVVVEVPSEDYEITQENIDTMGETLLIFDTHPIVYSEITYLETETREADPERQAELVISEDGAIRGA